MKTLLNKSQSNPVNDIVLDNCHIKFMCSVLTNSVALATVPQLRDES